MQVCTSLQTDNHASTPPLSFLQTGCPSCRPTNSVKALKALDDRAHICTEAPADLHLDAGRVQQLTGVGDVLCVSASHRLRLALQLARLPPDVAQPTAHVIAAAAAAAAVRQLPVGQRRFCAAVDDVNATLITDRDVNQSICCDKEARRLGYTVRQIVRNTIHIHTPV